MDHRTGPAAAEDSDPRQTGQFWFTPASLVHELPHEWPGAVAASRLRDDAQLRVGMEEVFGHPRARPAEIGALGSAAKAMTPEQCGQRFEELRNELQQRLRQHPGNEEYLTWLQWVPPLYK